VSSTKGREYSEHLREYPEYIEHLREYPLVKLGSVQRRAFGYKCHTNTKCYLQPAEELDYLTDLFCVGYYRESVYNTICFTGPSPFVTRYQNYNIHLLGVV
jgi:hypothetical protein